VFYAAFAILFVWCFVLCYRIHSVKAMATQARYVYVYNVDLLSRSYPALVSLQQNYQAQLEALTAQLDEIKAKIAKVSDAKAKEEVSNAYLAQITEKRNNLVASYQQSLQAMTAQVNRALEEVTTEKGLNAVFNSSAILVRTPYVIDITSDVLQKLK